MLRIVRIVLFVLTVVVVGGILVLSHIADPSPWVRGAVFFASVSVIPLMVAYAVLSDMDANRNRTDDWY